MLKAPPAMVKEITEWVQDAFSAWLAELPNFDLIEKARELQSVYFSKVREYEKLFGRNFESYKKPWRSPEMMKKWEEVNEADKRYNKAEARLKGLDRELFRRPETYRSHPEVQRAADRRKKPPKKVWFRAFDPNLKGWKYANLIPEGFDLDKIEVSIDLDEQDQIVGGSFGNNELILYPNVPKILQSKSGYKRLMREIETVIRHELQHYVQELFRDIGIKDFGNPSRKIRDLRYSPEGYLPMKGLDAHRRTVDQARRYGQKPYFLRDNEFYPWLRNTTDDFIEWATKQGLKGSSWDRARKGWVESKGSTIVRAQGKGNARLWNALKKHEPAKWRKAVGEFWKATEQPT